MISVDGSDKRKRDDDGLTDIIHRDIKWSRDELQRFFEALAVYSKHDAQPIAKAVRTKKFFHVTQLLQDLDDAAHTDEHFLKFCLDDLDRAKEASDSEEEEEEEAEEACLAEERKYRTLNDKIDSRPRTEEQLQVTRFFHLGRMQNFIKDHIIKNERGLMVSDCYKPVYNAMEEFVRHVLGHLLVVCHNKRKRLKVSSGLHMHLKTISLKDMKAVLETLDFYSEEHMSDHEATGSSAEEAKEDSAEMPQGD